jgi:P27 family predicted phage terminase small subunit
LKCFQLKVFFGGIMATRGRKPKPTTLKLLEGNPGKKPLPQGEPQPPGDLPPPPCFLDGYALEEWERISEGLNIMGVLTTVDQNALAAYCSAYSRFRHAEEQLNILTEKDALAGMIIKTAQGNYIQQPLIGIANKAALNMVKFAAEFGITPSARARLGIKPQSGRKSKFEGLIGGKQNS